MKKIIIAPDSFKGSISAADAAEAIAHGISAACPEYQIKKLPIADGGEGTLDAILPLHDRSCADILNTYLAPIRAEFGVLGGTAVIESARAVGLELTPPAARRLSRSTSFGVGQLITAALDGGHKSILLTVGGTGSNDGGAGMLEALGAAFYDTEGRRMRDIRAGELERITKIDLAGLDRRLYSTEITIACDVKNPLLGRTGATYVYGPQKGAKRGELASLEDGMQSYADILAATLGEDARHAAGAGAGGGIPYPLISIFGARVTPGIDAVLDALSFDSLLDDTALVVTGEGQIDAQTGCGKAIIGVASRAAARCVPVLALAGRFVGNSEDARLSGLRAVRTLAELTDDTEYSMHHAAELLERLAAIAVRDVLEADI